MESRGRRSRRSLNYWPGFVDALSTLVMVVVFVLLIFLVAQYFLASALSGRDAALERLTQQVNELTELLALEQGNSADLRSALTEATTALEAAEAARDDLASQVAALLEAQGELEGQLAAAEAEIAESQAALEAAEQTVAADRDMIEAQLAELALLESLRDQLTQEVADLEAALAAAQAKAATLEETATAEAEALKQALAQAKAELAGALEKLAALEARLTSAEDSATQGAAALDEQTQLTEEAKAQIEALNAQLLLLRQQLARLVIALEVSEAKTREQEVQIASLGERLNQALADKVQELARYRSEFFGRLREVLGERDDIRVVGDRFVFQSEVLFDIGQATLGTAGEAQLASLAATLKEIIPQIPTELDWVLQVNGHTDRLPIVNAPFDSNWELSAARAISVVTFLISEGVPPERLVAAGYGEFQPLDPADTPQAYQANRRIELKLTTR